MLIDLERSIEQEDRITKEIIVNLVSIFGNMKLVEIIDFFPTIDETNIRKKVDELIKTQHLIEKRDPAKNNIIYYGSPFLNQKGRGIKRRYKYYESLRFVRYLLNKTDSNGYLTYDIKCVGTDIYPYDIYYLCNGTIYDIIHCTKEEINLKEQVLSKLDLEKDKVDADYQRAQQADAPYIITEDKNRIILVDNIEDMDLIHFRKVKYIACHKDGRWFIKNGE